MIICWVESFVLVQMFAKWKCLHSNCWVNWWCFEVHFFHPFSTHFNDKLIFHPNFISFHYPSQHLIVGQQNCHKFTWINFLVKRKLVSSQGKHFHCHHVWTLKHKRWELLLSTDELYFTTLMLTDIQCLLERFVTWAKSRGMNRVDLVC